MDLNSPLTYLQLVIALLMLALPGVAVIMALRRWVDRRPTGLLSALLPGLALSIALWPILLLYLSLVGLSFVPWLIWTLLALAAIYIAYEAWSQRAQSKSEATRTTSKLDVSRFT